VVNVHSGGDAANVIWTLPLPLSPASSEDSAAEFQGLSLLLMTLLPFCLHSVFFSLFISSQLSSYFNGSGYFYDFEIHVPGTVLGHKG
jgi:hypothetical protein